MSFGARIPIELMNGLRPRVWICSGPGFSREEIKESLLDRDVAFTSDAVTEIANLCLKIIGHGNGAIATSTPTAAPTPAPELTVLGAHARQEGLRMLLADTRIGGHMPELKRLRRQSRFFKKLDRSIQAGRMAASHFTEQSIYMQRLDERMGPSELRNEIAHLAVAFEAWLQAESCADLPLLYAKAIERLESNSGFDRDFFPSRILYFTAREPESLEKSFWEALSRLVEVEFVGPLPRQEGELRSAVHVDGFSWQKWHTLDDAVEALADGIVQTAELADFADTAVVIPDTPEIRRSLLRAFNDRAIPLADPRDPTKLRWDETIKDALLPLQMTARNFERAQVISWLSSKLRTGGNAEESREINEWIEEINRRGIRSFLGSYAGGKLSSLHAKLVTLNDRLGGRKTCDEIACAHLALLGELQRDGVMEAINVAFFEKTWSDLQADLTRVGLGRRKAPAFFWLDRLLPRIEDATPPLERLKPRTGVNLYRLSQLPLKKFKQLFILGLPPNWLSGERCGNYWYSERDREILGAEFSVRSGLNARRERIATLRAWFGCVEANALESPVTFLDAVYDWDGRERESLLPLFREIGFELTATEKGAHPRWLESYGAMRPSQPSACELPRLKARDGQEKPVLRATEVDNYSRCPFIALGASRWRLNDAREADAELWPDVRGNILHHAVKLLIEARADDGSFALSPRDALEKAWSAQGAKGLMQGERLAAHEKKRLESVLEVFCEKERAYVERAMTKVKMLEGPEFELDFDSFKVIGRPDRVDEHEEGFFVLDYKTSAALPKGREMIDDGYHLQLPLYALGVEGKLSRPVLGLQFVELNRRGGRSNGVFFKSYNGKEPGKLTNARSNSASLIDLEPDTAWAICRESIVKQAREYLAGRFEAKPRREDECRSCRFSDLCGKRRRSDEET